MATLLALALAIAAVAIGSRIGRQLGEAWGTSPSSSSLLVVFTSLAALSPALFVSGAWPGGAAASIAVIGGIGIAATFVSSRFSRSRRR